MPVTPDEKIVVSKLAEAWDAFHCLPLEHPDDLNEFRAIIHAAQAKILARSGRREINGKA